MWRTQLKRVSLPASHRLPRTGNSLSKRTIASYFAGEKLLPVPVLRSTLWALAATATIYIGCAANDVRRDIQDTKRRGAFKDGRPSSYEDLEDAKRQRHYWHHRSHPSPASKWQPPGQIGEVLSRYDDAEKLVLGAVALNIALVGAGYFAPGPYMQYFAHIPVYSPSYTLLTSSFGHSGLLHVGINSLAMLQLGPSVARSPTFEGNGSHFAAFYLSTGIISALGHHLATTLPTRNYRIRRFNGYLGSSGIVMAITPIPFQFMSTANASQFSAAKTGYRYLLTPVPISFRVGLINY
ncbi:hypothetical protein Hte_009881 [Hypoxylon texense]